MQVIIIKRWIIRLLKTLYFCNGLLEIIHWNVHCFTPVTQRFYESNLGGSLMSAIFYRAVCPGLCRLWNWRGSLHWRHNGRDSVSNHQPYDCLLNRLFRRRSKKTWKLRVIGLCVGNSPGTGEFPAQMASNAENASIWWRHHAFKKLPYKNLLGNPSYE